MTLPTGLREAFQKPPQSAALGNPLQVSFDLVSKERLHKPLERTFLVYISQTEWEKGRKETPL